MNEIELNYSFFNDEKLFYIIFYYLYFFKSWEWDIEGVYVFMYGVCYGRGFYYICIWLWLVVIELNWRYLLKWKSFEWFKILNLDKSN